MRSGRSSIERSLFGRMPDGAAVERYTLRHSGGRTVCISTYGSTLLSLTAPDRLGRWTDRDTIINLTLHPYFNLRGSGDVLGHRLWLAGREYLPVDGALIPTGERRSVAATPFDFRSPRTIGARIGESDPQIRAAGGYDPTWVLADKRGMLKLDARVEEPETGRVLELLSTQPGLQFYAGQRLDGSVAGKGGQRYGPHSGFALEPQHFPDSPHHPAFPSTLLRAGDCYRHCIAYRFSILPVKGSVRAPGAPPLARPVRPGKHAETPPPPLPPLR